MPYIPSSTIRGKLRSSVTDQTKKDQLFGTDLQHTQNLEQGDIWIGDGSLLWLPVPSLSHGVVWISSPMLLRRWGKFNNKLNKPLTPYSCSFKQNNSSVYLKDAILKADDLNKWENWTEFVPKNSQASSIERVLVLPDQHCATVIQMSLWRQVKIKLDQHKSVDGGFRYEEAIPPDTLMYFPWGITSQANGTADDSCTKFKTLLSENKIIQIGGQENAPQS